MKKHVKRYLALAITFALIISIPFAFIQEASAASKKTKYVVTSKKTTYSAGYTVTTKNTYFKNGLLKSSTSSNGTDIVYTRNKKGYPTSSVETNNNSKVDDHSFYKYEYNKKGLPVKQYKYDEHNKLVSTYNVSFYKNGKVKESVEVLADSASTLTYRYNKKGDPTLIKFSSGSYTTQATYSYKYDKKGNPVESVTVEDVIDNGVTERRTTTTTYKYKYDKKKNIKKADITEVTVLNNGTRKTYTRTVTYNYKKVKVAKSFLKFFR